MFLYATQEVNSIKLIKVISLTLKYMHLIVTTGCTSFPIFINIDSWGQNVIKSMSVGYGKLCKEIINFSNSLNNIAM